uniref:ABCA5 n=1 Tax=Dermanyssus gallinae TaxID=34641 RepID=A0AA51BT43_9ACAR|nr:ABCA5 [Dermanyssus gallinae]
MENSMNKARDADVIAEKQRVDLIVAEHRTDEFALVVHKLAKRYGSVRAVRGLSFLVNFNECFGLLGVNGAGKTTTFGMLTGDISPSSGNAYIMAVDLKSGRSKFRTLVGYCPQEDALANKLTAKEMLALFCALRGIRRDETDEYVDRMVTVADLTGHENKLTSNCSGGNKRKICIAIAMVGNPPLLYLDEPTAGVDPSARRKIWAMLSEAQRELGTSIVFTSHTMGECEALCHRLAIMVAGTFRCIGSSHHLKEKFGQMFTVYVKLATDSIALERDITAAMKGLYPAGCGLRESHQRLLKYSVVKTGLPWSQAFERIQKLQDRFHEEIEDVQIRPPFEEVIHSVTNGLLLLRRFVRQLHVHGEALTEFRLEVLRRSQTAQATGYHDAYTDRRALVTLHAGQGAPDLTTRAGVDSSRRLVQVEQRGIGNHRHCNRQLSFVSATVCVRHFVGVLLEIGHRDDLVDERRRLLAGNASQRAQQLERFPARHGVDERVLLRTVADELLELGQVLAQAHALDVGVTGGHQLVAGEHPKRRALAGAVHSEQAKAFLLEQRKRDALNGLERTVRLAEVVRQQSIVTRRLLGNSCVDLQALSDHVRILHVASRAIDDVVEHELDALEVGLHEDQKHESTQANAQHGYHLEKHPLSRIERERRAVLETSRRILTRAG